MNMMMEDTNEGEKMEEVMLPGFRFHPTDEELVGFYLKRKIQQRPLSIELIKQLDIYKYDPWDLPKVASTGEKEWYFYCPRDRKYRNSVRPNRVTVAGFWKATGTDRPIYSSKENKCIGLKKSLVFYKGRAAKGVKTEWMMHEFRLPSLIDSSSPNTFMDKNMPANDSWAICRIFKKPTHSTAQRSQHHRSACPSPSLTITTPDPDPTTQLNCTTTLQQPFFTNNVDTHEVTCPIETLIANSYSRTLDSSTEALSSLYCNFNDEDLLNQFFPLPPLEATSELFSTPDVSAILQNMSCSNTLEDLGWLRAGGGVGSYGAPQVHGIPHNQEADSRLLMNNTYSSHEEEERWETMRSVGLEMNGSDAWKSSSMGLQWWDTPSCPGELSTLFSTTKCYT